MWQQLDCGIAQATPGNPSGCLADLFPWVEVSIGAGSKPITNVAFREGLKANPDRKNGGPSRTPDMKIRCSLVGES
jgi:hypothetical protein